MTTPISYIICIQCKILSVNVLPKKVVVVSPDVLLYHLVAIVFLIEMCRVLYTKD
jgi:uncharacterized protein (UPF0548 family)